MARPSSRSVQSTLPVKFYDRPVLEVAEDLIGCTVTFTRDRQTASGVIVETEAYHDSEPACHAYVGLTPRTETLFGPPGRAYVYRSYGVHALLNAVCEPEGVGAAVLIRALEPVRGIEAMRLRREASAGKPLRDQDLCSGPGKLTQALGITLAENNGDLTRGPIKIGARPADWAHPTVVGTRVGINKAVELQRRFCVAGNRHVSSPRPTDSR
jgi:DNA-3-methyladenine glycosylase